MDYELVKQLKDAGYPQKEKNCCIYPTLDVPAEYVYKPHLSELIEACGDVKLHHISSTNTSYANCCDRKSHEVSGSTPWIAVAKLWLRLNKK